MFGIRFIAVSGNDLVEQPLTGFGYSYWFVCTGCEGRVEIEADLFELQCTGQASYSVCSCGTAIDISAQSPTLRDVNDPALQINSVARLIWYHSSRHEHWPDLDAYTTEITDKATQTAQRFGDLVDPDLIIATKLSLAVHLGTFEAAIENILRRLKDQDRSDFFETRYWLHRVEIAIDSLTDLHPDVVEEFRTMFGDVELAQLRDLDAHAVRYVNRHEAIGSVSLAVDPVVISTVSTIALPLAEATLAETATATAAAARMMTQPQLDHGTPEWSDFAAILTSEYLPGVNPQVCEPFISAVGRGTDAGEFHRRFRVLAGMLMRPDVAIDLLAAEPRRQPPKG